MQKPPSIRRFDACYLGSLAVYVVSFFLGFDATVAQTRAEYAKAGVEMNPSGLITGFFLGVLAIQLLLWWLVSSRRSTVAKWVLVVLFALGLLATAVGFRTLADNFSLATAISLVSLVLSAAAIWFLFQPDATAWFDADEKR